jgi:hypothetical protein
MGAGQRLQRASTTASPSHHHAKPASLAPGGGGGGALSGGPAGLAAAASGGSGGSSYGKKNRRRWMEDDADDALGAGDDFIPVGRSTQEAPVNTGHIVRMRRGEAWGKFLAYEGCCQVGSADLRLELALRF